MRTINLIYFLHPEQFRRLFIARDHKNQMKQEDEEDDSLTRC